MTSPLLTAQADAHTHARLVQIAWRWLTTRGACDFAFTEFGTSGVGEMPDALGFLNERDTVLIEVKVSRSDFLADARKPWRVNPEQGMGSFRYYMAPRGLLKVSDLPEKWGLLEVLEYRLQYIHLHGCEYAQATQAFAERVQAERFAKNAEAEQALLYAAARRLHIKGCWGILKTPMTSTVRWEAT